MTNRSWELIENYLNTLLVRHKLYVRNPYELETAAYSTLMCWCCARDAEHSYGLVSKFAEFYATERATIGHGSTGSLADLRIAGVLVKASTSSTEKTSYKQVIQGYSRILLKLQRVIPPLVQLADCADDELEDS